MSTITAKISFEIELDLSGTLLAAEPQTRDDPGCYASVEDIDVEGIGIIEAVRPPLQERGSHRTVWKTTSILDGVDRNSDAYKQIVRNILAMKESEAAEALLEEASE